MQNNQISQQQKDPQALLSIGEASEYLGVSIDTLRRWEKKGRLVAFRSPGGHRYFEKDKLKGFFNQKYVREPGPVAPRETKLEQEPKPAPPPSVQPVSESLEPEQGPKTETILIPKTSIPTQETHAPEELTLPSQEEKTLLEQKIPSPVQKDRLREILAGEEKGKKNKAQIAAIVGLVVFAIVDIILIYVWFATPKLLSPVP